MVSAETELWEATRVIGMHTTQGRCAHCPPNDDDRCRLLRWAQVIRERSRQAGMPLPDPAGAWIPGDGRW